ncbi:hypothetical protein DFAR_250001 [Desulfarculales bacterium]
MPDYFDEAPKTIWLRRFRCPDCQAVIRLRPRGYWSRFQAPVETIRQSLSKFGSDTMHRPMLLVGDKRRKT